MNKIEFFKIFKKLCEYFNNKTYEDKELTGMYYIAVQDKSIEQFKKQVSEIIQISKFMPKISEFGSGKKVNFDERKYSKEFLESLYDNL